MIYIFTNMDMAEVSKLEADQKSAYTLYNIEEDCSDMEISVTKASKLARDKNTKETLS